MVTKSFPSNKQLRLFAVVAGNSDSWQKARRKHASPDYDAVIVFIFAERV
jgi:hypothetical protein